MNDQASRRLWLLLFALLHSFADSSLVAASNAECVLKDSSGALEYDLRQLGHWKDHYIVDGYDTGYSFEMNICNPLAKKPAKSATLSWQHAEQNGALSMLDTRIQLRGDKLLLESISGDACSEALNMTMSMLISFICDPNMEDNGQPVFVSEWSGCVFMFEWRTPAACQHHIPTDERQLSVNETNTANEVSRGAVIFVVIFVVGSIYLLGGFLYNRVLNMSSGLRGIEQFPNYRLWYGIYIICKRMVTAVGTGVLYLTDMIRGRRGAIRIDDAEHSIRGELFGTDDEEQDMLPITRR